MVGIGALELVIVALIGFIGLAFMVGLVVCIWALAGGRKQKPTHCPHCGADLRTIARQPYHQHS